ncbi:hypothetical protein Ahy_B01g051964 isoform B [Arachis hypogaea]|uniref:Uncharacterized protein n=1 Tax=Arachis hypogaea TaxID=3818 RepID=A0A445AN73_ARAHY|nr:hypothetical protein Ahy_B01g051964 isoform B [Arachis hypogaea]
MKAVVWSVEVVGVEGYGKLCVERKLPSSTEVRVIMKKPVPNVQPRDLPPIGLYVSEEVSDDDDPIYEYASEELHTPDQSQTQTESLAENSAVQEKSTNHVISQNAAATTPSAPVQIPFKPPSQQPRMGQPKTPATSSKFRPKQTIRRPRASTNSPSNPPATPPPDTTQTQSTSASVATSEETFKVAGSEAIGMNFIPTPVSKNQKN